MREFTTDDLVPHSLGPGPHEGRIALKGAVEIAAGEKFTVSDCGKTRTFVAGASETVTEVTKTLVAVTEE